MSKLEFILDLLKIQMIEIDVTCDAFIVDAVETDSGIRRFISLFGVEVDTKSFVELCKQYGTAKWCSCKGVGAINYRNDIGQDCHMVLNPLFTGPNRVKSFKIQKYTKGEISMLSFGVRFRSLSEKMNIEPYDIQLAVNAANVIY
mgnify:CR=1 FL=1